MTPECVTGTLQNRNGEQGRGKGGQKFKRVRGGAMREWQ